MPENILLSDLWEIHNMEFSLYTRVLSTRLFSYIIKKLKCRKLVYVEMLVSHENTNVVFFLFGYQLLYFSVPHSFIL